MAMATTAAAGTARRLFARRARRASANDLRGRPDHERRSGAISTSAGPAALEIASAADLDRCSATRLTAGATAKPIGNAPYWSTTYPGHVPIPSGSRGRIPRQKRAITSAHTRGQHALLEHAYLHDCALGNASRRVASRRLEQQACCSLCQACRAMSPVVGEARCDDPSPFRPIRYLALPLPRTGRRRRCPRCRSAPFTRSRLRPVFAPRCRSASLRLNWDPDYGVRVLYRAGDSRGAAWDLKRGEGAPPHGTSGRAASTHWPRVLGDHASAGSVFGDGGERGLPGRPSGGFICLSANRS
jgi:hypothetical protein